MAKSNCFLYIKYAIFIFLFSISNLITAKNMHPPSDSLQEYKTQAKELLQSMTLRQKVNELSGKKFYRSLFSFIFRGRPAAVQMGGNQKLHIPALYFSDGPRGVGVAESTDFPCTMARGCSWDTDLEYRIGDAMGIEARASGINYLGAVCINQLRHPAWGRAQETYGEDAYLLGEMGVALMKGIQKHHVMACVKHFAANNMENNRFTGNMKIDDRTLHEVYLPHFKKCVEHGAVSLMSAYNKVNGAYCAHNSYLLQTVLRQQWGFEGFISSDWFWGLKNTVAGIQSGMNIEMPFSQFYTYKKIKKNIASGNLSVADIDRLLLPVLTQKLAWSAKTDFRKYSKQDIATQEHLALAKEAAIKGTVLLKNEKAILPLDPHKIKKIAIMGRLAKTQNDGDKASSLVKPKSIVTPFEGIQNFIGENTTLLYASPRQEKQWKSIAAKADVVLIFAGYTFKEEGEYVHLKGQKAQPGKKPFLAKIGMLSSGDRTSLQLHDLDLKMIEAATSVNENVIVCIFSGSAVITSEWEHKVAAILLPFYNGMEGGNALAEIIFGKANPSAKLTFSIPKKENDLPRFENDEDEIAYSYFHGYTFLEKNNIPPAYPFGFGLSYTTFQYEHLTLQQEAIASENDLLKISVTVKNIGERAGDEIVQIYVAYPNSMVERPKKQLKAFKKISLNPGASTVVNFEIAAKELLYFQPETQSWVLEPGNYKILAARHAADENTLIQSFQINVHNE